MGIDWVEVNEAVKRINGLSTKQYAYPIQEDSVITLKTVPSLSSDIILLGNAYLAKHGAKHLRKITPRPTAEEIREKRKNQAKAAKRQSKKPVFVDN